MEHFVGLNKIGN